MSPVRFLENTTLPAPIMATLITSTAPGGKSTGEDTGASDFRPFLGGEELRQMRYVAGSDDVTTWAWLQRQHLGGENHIHVECMDVGSGLPWRDLAHKSAARVMASELIRKKTSRQRVIEVVEQPQGLEVAQPDQLA